MGQCIVIGVMIVVLSSCAPGLNYNQGRTHNEDLANRERIVRKQDEIMKKSMQKTRRKATPMKHRQGTRSKRTKNIIR
jgi:hypothetical protein